MLQSDLVASINGDAALALVLTGKAHGQRIDRIYTPTAFDGNRELLPCAFVKVSLDAPIPDARDTGMATVEVYLYQRVGFDVISQARDLLYALWHEQGIGGGTLLWADDVVDQHDDALKADLILTRFNHYRLR